MVAVVAIAVFVPINSATSAKTQGEELQSAVARAKNHATSGQFDHLPADIEEIAQATSHLRSTTSDWQWSMLTRIPGMADTTGAIAVTAAALDDIAVAAAPLADALARASSQTPSGATALIAQFPTLLPAVEQLANATSKAETSLDRIDSGGLKFGVDAQLAQAQTTVRELNAASQAAVDSWPALEGLLGFKEPREYLVMLQNPAEARGSGGLFSAFMRVTLNNGIPKIEEANSRKVLDEGRIPVPNAIDDGEEAMWGDYLTKWASFNTSPDFPTTAQLAMAGMKARGTPVDGVITIDPFAVQAVLAGTGPVEHKGVTIDQSTAAEFFTKGIYQDFPGFADVEAKDELALGLLYATVDSVLKRPLDLKALADTIPAAITDGHIQAWSNRDDDNAWLEQMKLTTDVTMLDPTTTVIALNNAVGGKVDAYVTTTVKQEIGTCVYPKGDFKGWPQSILAITLTNNAPSELPEYVDTRLDDAKAPKGSTRMLVTSLGTPGAVDTDLTVDGDFADYMSGQAHGRPYWVTSIDLERGQSRTLTITTAQPPSANQQGSTAVVTGAYSPATTTTTNRNSTAPCNNPMD